MKEEFRSQLVDLGGGTVEEQVGGGFELGLAEAAEVLFLGFECRIFLVGKSEKMGTEVVVVGQETA